MVTLKTIAVVIVLLGAVALAFPTMATEGFDIERPASFSLGSDSNAAISAEQTEKVVHHSGKDNLAVVGKLVNNLDTDIQMTYRVSVPDPSVEPVPARKSVHLQPEESTAVTMRCLSPGQDAGKGTTIVTVTVESAQGDGIGIENADFEFPVEYECVSSKQGGPPEDPGNEDEEDEEGDNDSPGQGGPPEDNENNDDEEEDEEDEQEEEDDDEDDE